MSADKISFPPVKIKVIGIGGAGCNAVTRMVRDQIFGAEFIAMNTDVQHLAITEAPIRLQLGRKATKGQGAGGSQYLGQKAAYESEDEIKEIIGRPDIVFIVAGMGGGTGTGAAPVVSEIAHKSEALTVAVITRPFDFEGTRRAEVAGEGLKCLSEFTDSIISIANDNVIKAVNEKTGIEDAFNLSDSVLSRAVQSIVELITVPGYINLDLADVRKILKQSGQACIATGSATGPYRAQHVVEEALSNPLMEFPYNGARRVMFQITGNDKLKLHEVRYIAEALQKGADPDAEIIFGLGTDNRLEDEIRLTIIAAQSSPLQSSNIKAKPQ